MLVGIHQLHYLPWLRYLHKLIHSDVFVILDNIQYNKNGHQNRNRIKTPQGDLSLTVPVYDHFAQRLDEVRIDNKRPWARKHGRSIEQHYRRAPFFDHYRDWLSDVYRQPWEMLNDLNRALLEGIVERLAIDTPIVYASDLAVPGDATERLVNLIQAVDGTAYYSGAHAVDTYLDVDRLREAHIALRTQSWTAPVYPQCSEPFVPELSILDLMMNCGPESTDILRSIGP